MKHKELVKMKNAYNKKTLSNINVSNFEQESCYAAKSNIESAISLLSVFKGRPSKKLVRKIESWQTTYNKAFQGVI